MGLPILNDENKDLTEKIRWLLLLRVIVLTCFLGASAISHFIGTANAGPYLFDLSIPLVAAYLVSIISALLLPRVSDLKSFALAQIAFDVLIVTGIIWVTGDLGSPFPFLYNLAVMNAAILLFHRGAYLTAGFASFCYTAILIWARYSVPDANLTVNWALLVQVFLNIGSFFIIAWLSSLLTSKLRTTQELLKEKQTDYQELDALKEALLQGIGSGVAVTDQHGKINYFNRHAQTLTGLEDATVRGKRLESIFPGLSYDFDKKRDGHHVASTELAFSSSQSGLKQLRVTVAPLNNSGDELIGHVAILEDITRQKEFEEKLRLEEELRKAREQDYQQTTIATENGEFQFEGVIGRSGGIEKIYQLIQKVAATSTNILISGESGTGKELVARAIHINGPRNNKPFVAVNCGAIPEALMESELFGHVRGAFTGAVSDHVGLFKQADQGTIFLDEVGELPLQLQVKLLRVLQDKSFTPVGGSKQIKVDVRVISATNRELRKEMEVGRFREDLFYRLNVVQMVMPPLRNRKEDIPALAHYFLRKFATAHDKKVEEISSGALMHLIGYSYPGNVRELENILEHSVAVTTKNILTEEDLPTQVKGLPITEEADVFEKTAPGGADGFFNKGLSLDVELETHEKCILLGALKRANGVQKRAAEILGINYRSLRHRLEKYDMLNNKHQGFTGEEKAEQ